jgi:hypothetical protein
MVVDESAEHQLLKCPTDEERKLKIRFTLSGNIGINLGVFKNFQEILVHLLPVKNADVGETLQYGVCQLLNLLRKKG